MGNEMKTAKISNKLRPVAVSNLIRLGQDNDGGYLVDSDSVKNSDILLSFGIADDWSFEERFTHLNNVPLHAFDGTIDLSRHMKRLFKSIIMINKPYLFGRRLKKLQSFRSFFRGHRKYHKVMVGAATDRSTSLEQLIETYVKGKYEHIFIKSDIEGSEYRLLDDMVKYANLIEGMVIEFHDVDLNIARIIDFIQRTPLVICHCHANNSAGVAANGLPFLLEISFARPKETQSGYAQIPNILDQPNNPRQEDINMYFAE
jgi:hypothetical protein